MRPALKGSAALRLKQPCAQDGSLLNGSPLHYVPGDLQKLSSTGGIAHHIHKLPSGALLREVFSMQCITEGQSMTSGRLSLLSDQRPCGQSQIINLQPSLARHVSNMHTQDPQYWTLDRKK